MLVLDQFVSIETFWSQADIVRDWRWNHKVKKKNLATNKCFCSNQESQTNPFEIVSAQTKQHVTVNGILDLNLFPSTLQVGNPPGAILQVGARELSR